MSRELDHESVIFSLTEGIGAGFGSAARKSFFVQLERLERHPAFLKSSSMERQALVDILAVASFYHSVIVPIESGGAFVSVLREAGATHLRVAGDRLDRAFANKAEMITGNFRLVLNRARIPEPVLTYATLGDFISQSREYFQMRAHETLD